jgi:hypothetical protein
MELIMMNAEKGMISTLREKQALTPMKTNAEESAKVKAL